MLNDPKVQEQLKTKIDEYFQLNDNRTVSPALLWDGAKAVVRRKLIELVIKLKKQHVQKQIELESKIKRLEQAHKNNRKEETRKQLQSCSEALDKLLTYKAEGDMRYTGQKYYEMVNRASSLLTFQLRKTQASRIIPSIRHPSNKKELSQPRHIAAALREFYKICITHQIHPRNGELL